MTKFIRDTITATGADLAPGFDIDISGKDTSEGTGLFNALRSLISEVVFEDDEDLCSTMEITFLNAPDSGLGKPVNWYAVPDTLGLQEGNYLDLYMGYGNNRVFMDRCETIKWLPHFPEEGPGSFTIHAYDGRHWMQNENRRSANKKKAKTFYKNRADEDIVRALSGKYGFASEVDPTEVVMKKIVTVSSGARKIKHVIPTRPHPVDVTDWAFLQKLAKINRFDLWVDYSFKKKKYVVHFKKRKDIDDAIFEFAYNGGDYSLLSAEPDFSVKDQTTAVEVHFFDRQTKKLTTAVIEEENREEDVFFANAGPRQFYAKKSIVRGARVRFTAYGQTITAVADRAFKNKKEAARFAEYYLAERERELLVLQGVVVGEPTIRARQIHKITGLGSRIDGFYRLTNTRHIMRPGEIYIVEFTGHKVLDIRVTRKPKDTVTGRGGIELIHMYNRHSRYGAKDPVKVKKKY
jgi:phage protein D